MQLRWFTRLVRMLVQTPSAWGAIPRIKYDREIMSCLSWVPSGRDGCCQDSVPSNLNTDNQVKENKSIFQTLPGQVNGHTKAKKMLILKCNFKCILNNERMEWKFQHGAIKTWFCYKWADTKSGEVCRHLLHKFAVNKDQEWPITAQESRWKRNLKRL